MLYFLYKVLWLNESCVEGVLPSFFHTCWNAPSCKSILTLLLWHCFIMWHLLILSHNTGCGTALSPSGTQLLTTQWSPGADIHNGGCNRSVFLGLPRGGGLLQRIPAPAGWPARCLHPAATWQTSGGQTVRFHDASHWMAYLNTDSYKPVKLEEHTQLQVLLLFTPPTFALPEDLASLSSRW